MPEHRDITTGDMHDLFNWRPAYATARGALSVAAGDVGKLAWQLSDNTLWVLLDDSPLTWLQVFGAAGVLTLADGQNIAANATTGTKIGTATSQKLAVWNQTPIAQPSSTGQTSGFTAGIGTPVLSDSVFTGGSGSTAYTIGDLVKHLKAIGLLAG